MVGTDLVGLRPLREDGGMEDDVLHVGQRADSVEEQLRPVLAPHVNHSVAFVWAAPHRNQGLVLLLPVVVPDEVAIGVHHLVQPPLRVGQPRGHRRLGPPTVPVPPQDVAEQLLYAGQAGGVTDRRRRRVIGDVDDGGHSGVVSPNFGSHHVALEVGEDSEDLRQKPRPVRAGELDRGVLGGRLDTDGPPRRPDGASPRPQRLVHTAQALEHRSGFSSLRSLR